MSAVVACQPDGVAPQPTRTAALPSVTPTPTPTSDRDAVLAAYRALYREGPRAERAHPKERRAILKQVATWPLLDSMLEGIAALRADGRMTYGYPIFRFFDVQIGGDRAALHDCQDARNVGQADEKTGKRLSHGVTGTHMVAALIKESDGMWRVAKVDQLKVPCSSAA
ncbi:hypothetical protein [Spongiactinospora sp. TRM90649]|uniref:hypothetical protein n=1 Tax=Spongiactinospora sp. TRM90649 TaxID=3031114 RepID=UPI0023F7C4EA|nr:hypothetical protein [Spongiactinospora sp. TRM90649]MDF5758430.1 hypothetical protein [Spongiactinospora sp. TRM90649]